MPLLLPRKRTFSIIRPTGNVELNMSDPFNSGLLMSMYDNGEGLYLILADSSTGQSAPNNIHYMAPPFQYGGGTIGGGGAGNPTSLPSIEASNYGPAFRHDGSGTNKIAGFNTWSWTGEAIRDAQNLYNKGTNAGFSLEAFLQFDGVSANDPGIIYGRTANGWQEGGTQSCSAVLSNGGSTRQVVFTFFRDGPSTVASIASPLEYATGVLTHAIASCKNDSAGSATVNLHVNGVTVATVSGQDIRDLNYQTEDSLEGQTMIGASAHIFAGGDVSGHFNGKVFMGNTYNYGITEAQALARYQQLWGRVTQL